MADGDWTDERVSALRRYWASGISAGKISERFGGLFSRSAVIGKVHRLKLARRSTTPKAVGRRSRQVRLAAQKRASVLALQGDGWTPQPDQAPERLVSIADWPSDACQWPYGGFDQPVMFGCTCDRVPGLPYCSNHIKRAYRPPEPERKHKATDTPTFKENSCSPLRTAFIGHSKVEAGE